MKALAQAEAAIDAKFDPKSEDTLIRAATSRLRLRADRRAFINDALKRPNCCWHVLGYLASHWRWERFLSFDEAAAALRRELRICKAQAKKGRVHRIATPDVRHRLIIARYFARHARALLSQDVREVA